MTNIATQRNPEFDDPTASHPELDHFELTAAVAIRSELSSIVNRSAIPTAAPTGHAAKRWHFGSSRRRRRIAGAVLTLLSTAVGAVALNTNGSTALAAQYQGAAIPDREPHYAPTSLPYGYSISKLFRPVALKNPVAQTLILGTDQNNQIRDYTVIDLLGPGAPREITQPPDGAAITDVNGHKSWVVANGDPNWLFRQVVLECGTATILLEAGQHDAALRRLGALSCSENQLKIKAVDSLSLLYDGPPYAQQNDIFIFSVTNPSGTYTSVSVGWSFSLPVDIEKRLSNFVPAKPPSNEVLINESAGLLFFDPNDGFFRLSFAMPAESEGGRAQIQVFGKSKDEVLLIARSMQSVSGIRWKSIAERAGIKP